MSKAILFSGLISSVLLFFQTGHAAEAKAKRTVASSDLTKTIVHCSINSHQLTKNMSPTDITVVDQVKTKNGILSIIMDNPKRLTIILKSNGTVFRTEGDGKIMHDIETKSTHSLVLCNTAQIPRDANIPDEIPASFE